MKNVKLFAVVISIALAFCILFAAVSCSSDKDKYSDIFELLSQYYDISDNVPEPKETRRLVVVVPEGCSAAVLDSAQRIVDALSERSYVEIKVKYDTDHKYNSKQTEILVGATDRIESSDFQKDLRINDYGYGRDGDKIIISGRTDYGCTAAVKLFLDDVSVGIVDGTIVKDIKKKIVRSSYAIEEMYICGFEASEYAIVYPYENAHGEKEVAEALSKGISGFGGYVLPVLSQNEITSSTRAICVGKTPLSLTATPKDSAVIGTTQQGNIELIANDEYGLSLAADKLLELIWGAKQGKVSKVDIDSKTTLNYKSTDVKLLFVRNAFDKGDLDIYRKTADIMSAEAPSVAVFHDCTEEVQRNLENNLGEISSLGGRVFYIMADGVRLVEEKIESVSDGAVYTLTFESGDGEYARRWSVVGVIEPSSSGSAEKKEMYAHFSVFCMSDIPVIAYFNMPDYLEGMLIADVEGMETIGNGCYINSCSDSFIAAAPRSEEISTDVIAELVEASAYAK